MKHFLKVLAVVLIIPCTCSIELFAQLTPSQLLNQADADFEKSQFRSALKLYKQAGNISTWKSDIKLRAGICEYEINDVDGALSIFYHLINEGKTDPEVFLYTAKALHQKQRFNDAVKYYKQFLKKTKTGAPERDFVKDEILRCAQGMRIKYGEEIAYVENIGTSINTLENEFSPVPSPTYADRMYFSSDRSGSLGGKVDSEGNRDRRFGNYRADIYSIDLVSGIWQNATPMQGAINSDLHEVISAFHPNGQILYYFQGSSLDRGEIVIDTFEQESGTTRRGKIQHPIIPSSGDQDLYVVNDSIMLFSSLRPGGMGGYDLYITLFRNGKWIEPENLGAEINSFYDERNPFLTNNGRTLFFSSNSFQSIGGKDVFRSDFDEKSGKWSTPRNLGIPINSPGDEEGFVVSKDGLSAFLSSDRKTGYGGMDIYSVYFKNQLEEQLTFSSPVTFYQRLDQLKRESGDEILSEETSSSQHLEIKEYYLSNLYFTNDDIIINPQNIKKLDLISNLMLIYPKIRLELICHDISSGPKVFDLFFSIKKTEKIRDYLVRKGVQSDRINLKGAGSNYPLAAGDGINSPISLKYNKRIDVFMHDYEDEPVKLMMEDPQVPADMQTFIGKRFNKIKSGRLYYQLQIAATGQMYQNPILEQYTDSMIEVDPKTGHYRYLLGMFSTYKESEEALSKLRRESNLQDAFIVAYLDGERISRLRASDFTEEFPDLIKYQIQ